MFLAPAFILGLFMVAGAGYLTYDLVTGRRAARLDAVRNDPADFVHARLNEEAPHQFSLNGKVTQAETNLTEATGKAAAIGKELPNDPPSRPWVIKVIAFTFLWLIAFTVQFVLDFRIAEAITGNTGGAALTSLVVSGLLSAIALAAAMLWEKRATVSRRQLSMGLLAAAALMCIVLSVIVTLAPKRAELDYAARIDTAEQQLAMFNEDGDTTAAALTQTTIDRLETQRDQAKTFYQATAVAAGLLEGGASLAVPSGYLLMNYYGAQSVVRRRTKDVAQARRKLAQRRQGFAARMSGLLERAGVSQDQLGPFLARTGAHVAENPPAQIRRQPAAIPGEPAANTPVRTTEAATQEFMLPEDAASAVRAQPRQTSTSNPGRTDLHNQTVPGDTPDPSFDQA